MANGQSLTISAAVALLLVAGAGCADDSGDDSAESTPSTSEMSTSSGESTPTSDSRAAATAATSVVHEYFAVLDDVRQQPNESLDVLKTVATSSQLAAQRRLVSDERGKGRHQTGTTRVAELNVQSVNLDNSDPDAGKVPTVTIDICWDVSNVDIVDANGESVVSPDRPVRGWTRYTVANYQWSKDQSNGWRVATGEDIEQEPCRVS